LQSTTAVEKVIGFCPPCGRAIVFGQEAWEVGSALVCSRVSCILKQIKAEKRRAGAVSHMDRLKNAGEHSIAASQSI
ncbi:hypothetical protein, partial [Paenibacillus popilliae]